ncbi:MAG: hypothetical protein ACRCUP_05570 [Mycoplasmatales bacterium]
MNLITLFDAYVMSPDYRKKEKRDHDFISRKNSWKRMYGIEVKADVLEYAAQNAYGMSYKEFEEKITTLSRIDATHNYDMLQWYAFDREEGIVNLEEAIKRRDDRLRAMKVDLTASFGEQEEQVAKWLDENLKSTKLFQSFDGDLDAENKQALAGAKTFAEFVDVVYKIGKEIMAKKPPSGEVYDSKASDELTKALDALSTPTSKFFAQVTNKRVMFNHVIINFEALCLEDARYKYDYYAHNDERFPCLGEFVPKYTSFTNKEAKAIGFPFVMRYHRYSSRIWFQHQLKAIGLYDKYKDHFYTTGAHIYVTAVDEFDYSVRRNTPEELLQEAWETGLVKEEHFDYIEDGIYLPAREVAKRYQAKKGVH